MTIASTPAPTTLPTGSRNFLAVLLAVLAVAAVVVMVMAFPQELLVLRVTS
ncbi:hypothetical protein PD653_2271 [Nocardioides sp. PD653]|nr:hypothetical protein PD653_2271 [Nocardioides sp. PD653]